VAVVAQAALVMHLPQMVVMVDQVVVQLAQLVLVEQARLIKVLLAEIHQLMQDQAAVAQEVLEHLSIKIMAVMAAQE
jgi:hypothetical protein